MPFCPWSHYWAQGKWWDSANLWLQTLNNTHVLSFYENPWDYRHLVELSWPVRPRTYRQRTAVRDHTSRHQCHGLQRHPQWLGQSERSVHHDVFSIRFDNQL